ncbi:MAG: hypothetical protein QOH93_1460 [Chloroflexia bacterium]|nr:hypothetical protein [Chloroflexia bacterium]
MATPPVDIGTLIIRKPGVRGGRPHIAGTGVSLRTIVYMQREGLTPDEMVRRMPHLSHVHVYAALAHYYANKEEVDTEMAELEAEETRLEEELLARLARQQLVR